MKTLLNFTKRVIIFLIIWGIIVTPMVSAQNTPAPAGGPSVALPPPGSNPAANNAKYSGLTPPGQATSQQSADRLAKIRKSDYEECVSESKKSKNKSAGRAIADGITKPIKNRVNEKLGLEVLPNTINTLGDSAGVASTNIQENLKYEFQEGFKTRWGEEFPKTLAKNLEADRRAGFTAEYYRQNEGQFKKLIDSSVRETLPNVLNDDFVGNATSRGISGGLRRTLQDTFKLEIGKTARPTIETYYRAQLNTMIQQIPEMVRDQVEDVRGTIEGTKIAIMAAIENLKKSFSPVAGLGPLGDLLGIFFGAISVPSTLKDVERIIENLVAQLDASKEFLLWLANLDPDQLLEDMIDGLSFELEQSMTDPKHINRLTDAMMGAIEKPINNSIENSIDKVIDSIAVPTEALENAIDTFDEALLDPITDAIDQQLNIAVATIAYPISSTIDTLGNTLADTIDATLGATFYPLAHGITGTAFEIGGVAADGISNLGNGLWSAVYPPPPTLEVLENAQYDQLDAAGQLQPNQMRASDYDIAQANGMRLTADQNTIPGQGSMSLEDYQASFPDGAPMESAMSEVGTGAQQDLQNGGVERAANGAVEKQVGPGQLTSNNLEASKIMQGLKNNIGASVAAGAGSLVEGIPLAGPILAPIVEQLVAEGMAAIGFGTVGGGAAAFPVAEVGPELGSIFSIAATSKGNAKTTNKILNTEEQSRDLNERLTILQIQTCTFLKTMRRIQLMDEENRLITTPNAEKNTLGGLHAFLEKIKKDLNTGVGMSPGMLGVEGEGNGQSIMPRNPDQFVQQRDQEKFKVSMQDLKTLAEDDPETYHLVPDIREKLEIEEMQTVAGEIASDGLPKTQYDQFTSPGGFEEGGGWTSWMKLILINPITVYFKTRDAVNSLRAQALARAEADLAAGNGILGRYECPQENRVEVELEDKTTWLCRGYDTTLAPGIAEEATKKIFFTPVDVSVQNPKLDVAKGELEHVADRLDDAPGYFEAEKAPSIYNGSDPCPGPGPCPNAGWPNKDSGFLRRNNYEDPSTRTSSLGTSIGLGDILPVFVNMRAETPSLAQVNGGQKDDSRIIWDTTNADRCEAGNDWISSTADTTVAKAGEKLNNDGFRTISHPVEMRAELTRTRAGVATTETLSDTLTPNRLADRVEYKPTQGALALDIYRLTIGQNITLEVMSATNRTPVEVIELLKNKIELEKNGTGPLAQMLKRYTFTYGTSEGAIYLSITPKLTYILKCTGDNDQETIKEVTITRN